MRSQNDWNRIREWLVIALAASGITLAAQGRGATKGARDPSIAPGKELALLQSLVGTWRVTELWEPWEGMTPGGQGTGTQLVEAGPGGMSVAVSYRALTGPFPGYRAQGLMSWEGDKRPLPFHSAWVQSATPGVSVETGWLDGNDLVMSYEVVERGTPYTVKNVYSNMSHGTYTVTSYFVDKAGETRKVLTLKYVRQS